MSRRIDQIQPVLVAISRVVMQPDALRFDGNPALALQIHGIEHLRCHLTLGKRAGQARANDRPAWIYRGRCAR